MEAETEVGALPEKEAETPGGFEINGRRYAIPTLDTINLDEERILYVYADVVLQDFAPVHPTATDEEKWLYETTQMRHVRNPNFKRALAHIAYRRENPDVPEEEIQSAIGLANALETDRALLLATQGGEDEDPPSQGSQTSLSSESDESAESAQKNGLSQPTMTGSVTETESASLVLIPSPTGTHESDTSSASSPVTVA